MSRLEFTSPTKRAAFKRSNGICECHRIPWLKRPDGCGAYLITGNTFYEHIYPAALGGACVLENAAVLCKTCWKEKTARYDLPTIAKASRVRDRDRGIKKNYFRPLLGTKRSGIKIPFEGPPIDRKTGRPWRSAPPEVPEQWHSIVNFEGRYEVSSGGNVRSRDRFLVSRDGKRKCLTGKVLSPAAGQPGYRVVQIAGKTRHVAHLVAEAFLGPRPKGMHVAHLNGIAWDDRAENLVYATPKENNAHKVQHGTLRCGENLHLTRFPASIIAQIRREYRNADVSQRTLAKKYGMSQSNISFITRGASWKQLEEPANG